MQTKKRTDLIFLLILLAYLAYAGFYIYKTSFLVGGERYFILNDDAMISMRYAYNLAHGQGLVWTPGERVEGFTNPLWVLYMAIFHFLPIPASKMSLPIQISGLVFLALNLFYVRKIAFAFSRSEIASLLAVTLTAFYGPLNNWGLLGMEVSVLTLLVSAAVWAVLQDLQAGRFSWKPYVLLAVGTLIRMDMAVPYLTVWLALTYFDKDHRRQHLWQGFGLLAVILAVQTGWRYAYYGAWLPNTYTLKMTGLPFLVRVGNGLYAFLVLVWRTNWLLALLPVTLLLRRRDRQLALLALVFAGQVAYSIYVGGDAWEHKGGANRYIALAIPVYFVLFTTAVETLVNRCWTFVTLNGRKLAQALLIGFVMASMVQFNAVLDVRSLRKWILTARPEFTVGNEEYVHISLALEKITTPDATLAVVTAGTIPYLTDNPTIDLLGKNDAVIAALDSHFPKGTLARYTGFRPGHSKWDYAYSIGKLQPDVIVQLWGDTDEARPYIDGQYTIVEIDGLTFSARNDSPNILWDNADAIITP